MGIKFTDENDEEIEYEVVETTTLGGNIYLLVADEEDNARILKEIISGDDSEMASYTEDMTDSEYDAVAYVFEKLLGEYDISLQ